MVVVVMMMMMMIVMVMMQAWVTIDQDSLSWHLGGECGYARAS